MKRVGVELVLVGCVALCAVAIHRQIRLLDIPVLIGSGDSVVTDQAPAGVVATPDDLGSRAKQTSTAYQKPTPSNVASIRPKPADKPHPSLPATRYVTINNKTYPLRTYKMSAVPNDPFMPQWWSSSAGVNSMWDTPRGSRSTLLAVIDTGFALNHEEFVNRWYQNPGESGPATSEGPSRLNCTDQRLSLDASCNLVDDNYDGVTDNESGLVTYENASRFNCTAQNKPIQKSCNRIDDDGNGYVDDLSGWDFANDDDSVQTGELFDTGDGIRHGTMVAGIAAATGNNSKGIAGVDWGTTILPIQALDDDGVGTTISVGNAIRYAADRGSNVINISLGSELSDEYVRESVAYAIERGAVIVASSGNDGCDCISYPAAYPEVLAVGALDTTNSPASYSSWGNSLDLVAPGSQITAPSWSASNSTTAYATGSGTSFAAPVVSGTLTRLLSHQPSTTPIQLMAALLENTDRQGIVGSAPRSNSLGYGKIAAHTATSRVGTPKHSAIAYRLSNVSTGNVLDPSNPLEPLSDYLVMPCLSGAGATPVHELTKGAVRFYAVSQVERYRAGVTGYSSSLFAHACISQPGDTADAVRQLNTSAEFRDIFTVHQ